MAKRDSSWFYRSAPNPLMSPSQYKVATGCRRRWGFRYLEGLREPQSEKAAWGDQKHGYLEAWVKHGVMPTDPATLHAMVHAPAPGHAEAEVVARVDCAGASWFGFIDVAYNSHNGKVVELQPGGLTVIQDWKFTTSYDYALTPEELLADPAALLYSAAAYEGGAELVKTKFVYTTFDGRRASKVVEQTMYRDETFSGLAALAPTVLETYQHRRDFKARRLKVLDLPVNTDQCRAFGKRCTFYEQCQPPLDKSLCMPKGDDQMTQTTNQDFRNHVTERFSPPPIPPIPGLPPVPSAPPAAPPIPAAAPLPTPENGFVNPAGYVPSVPAASPEDLAAQQVGIDAETPEIKDDLTDMTQPQLRALAMQMGLIGEGKRPREATLRAMIREARRRPAPDVQVGEMTITHHDGSQTRVTAAGSTVDAQTGEVKAPSGEQVVPPIARFEVALEPSKITNEQLAEALDSIGWHGCLFINCRPEIAHTKSADTAKLLEAGNQRLFETHPDKPRDYRFIQYTAVAEFCCAVQDWLSTADVSDVYLDTRTPEGMALVNTLLGMVSPDRVIRGV